MRINDVIEIRPGIIRKVNSGKYTYQPITSTITSLLSENNQLQIAYPGGLIGVGTNIDPSITRADKIVGQILGKGVLPKVYMEIDIHYVLINNTLELLKHHEVIQIHIDSQCVNARVNHTKSDLARLILDRPACVIKDARFTISRKLGASLSLSKSWRLAGIGRMIEGQEVEIH